MNSTKKVFFLTICSLTVVLSSNWYGLFNKPTIVNDDCDNGYISLVDFEEGFGEHSKATFFPNDDALISTDDSFVDEHTSIISIIKDSGRMLFSAHRGAEGQAPYGSYPSYLMACEQGWDMIQIARARQSADGTWYCLHDPTVDAQTNGTGYISELTDDYINTIYQDDGVNVSSYSIEEMRLPKLETIIELALTNGVFVSIRMGSLPEIINSDKDFEAWNSFISLCSKYDPYKMMFSGTIEQVDILKNLTDNWHGQIYVTTDSVSQSLQMLIDRGYSNCSILASETFVSENIIEEIHSADYLYVSTQSKDRTLEDFRNLEKAGCDIVQTGISSINSLV